MTDSFTGEVVYAFPKNAYEEIWAYIQNYRGQQLVHLRIVATDENNGGRLTRRGLTVKVEDLGELVEAVARLCAAVEEPKDD